MAGARGRLVVRLGDAVVRWGGQVPEDPGIAELADLLEKTAGGLALPDAVRCGPQAELARAVDHLRAAARLGGLLPAVTLWHLHSAVRWEQAARDGLRN
ncbi:MULTISPECIES: hypothetical protein [unclassified Streptomyces]|uniref:hypothetical protein n=1 Tax=Streptomyces sp. NPDC055082 TaxID=3365718 RepID=UPI0037CF5129